MIERRHACWGCSKPWVTFSPDPDQDDAVPSDRECPFCGETAVILRAAVTFHLKEAA